LPEFLSRHSLLRDENATQTLAAAIAAALPGDTAGWSILFEGPLGSGKSTLARALLRRLGHRGPVPSPTYTLVEPYNLPERTVYHIDLYRISDSSELEYLGWTDWQDGLMLVEWPERAGRWLERADLRIRLAYADPGRRAAIEAESERGNALLARLDQVSDYP
jgi:tRNA threonylcarbamoyladenosine biosynthesis protein TsaE